MGDSPITGAGCYVEKGVGGAAATGDGDIMMRFLPAYVSHSSMSLIINPTCHISRYEVVQSMSVGVHPKDAAMAALEKIHKFYPNYSGALIAVTTSGEYGAAFSGFGGFQYTVYSPELGKSTILNA